METNAKFLTCHGDGENFRSVRPCNAVEYLRGIVDIELMNQAFTDTETFTINGNDVIFSPLPIDDAIANILYAKMETKFCGRVPFTRDDLRYKCLNQRLDYAWDTDDGLWVIKMLQIDSLSGGKEITFGFKRIICPF